MSHYREVLCGVTIMTHKDRAQLDEKLKERH